MKHFILSLLWVAMATGSYAQSSVINNPETFASSSDGIEIYRVELSDSATILYMDVYILPGYWMALSSQTYLLGNTTGKHYQLIRSEGFELDTKVNMPPSGNVSFKLLFEPLDKQDDNIDFVEYPGEKMFLISGIDLTGKRPESKIACTIKGTVVDRPQSNRLMLLPHGNDLRVYPWMSIPIRDGKFEYTFYTEAEEVYELVFFEEYLRGSFLPFPFFAENGVIEFTLYPSDKFDKSNISTTLPLNSAYIAYEQKKNALFSPTLVRDAYRKLQEEDEVFTEAAKSLFEKRAAATNAEEKANLSIELDELAKEPEKMYTSELLAVRKRANQRNKEIVAFESDCVTRNSSLVEYYRLLWIVEGNAMTGKLAEVAPLLAAYTDVYSKKYPDHPFTEKMKLILLGDGMEVGGHYIDFTAPDLQGNEITLSDQIKGKVALIDLWASWCGYCRSDSKDMIPVYEAYKDKGFTVVGVARENNPQSMADAIKKDGYPWLNLLELKDRDKIWEKYGVGNGGGGMFLVDSTGKIIAKGPTAKEVSKILADLFPD
jgi:peroxiredoxin